MENQPLLGRGTFGKVVLTPDGDAVKIIPNRFDYAPKVSTVVEAAVAQGVDHPYLINAKSVNVLRKETLIVYPLAKENLKSLVNSFRDIDIKRLLYRIGLAIAKLHSYGISHNDIKVENILMFDDQTPVLADYGACNWYCIPNVSVQPGTYIISSPEMILSEKSSSKNDVWGFGVLIALLEMGKHIFDPGNDSKEEILAKITAVTGIGGGDVSLIPRTETLDQLVEDDILLELLKFIFVEEENRPTIAQVLQSSYFDQVREGELDIPITRDCQDSLKFNLPPKKNNFEKERYNFLLWLKDDVFRNKKSINLFLTAIDIYDTYMQPYWFDHMTEYTKVVFYYAYALHGVVLDISENTIDVLKDFNRLSQLRLEPSKFLPMNKSKSTTIRLGLLSIVGMDIYPSFSDVERLEFINSINY